MSDEAEPGSRQKFMRVDAQTRPVELLISPGHDHDITGAEALPDGPERRARIALLTILHCRKRRRH